jgi:hypothetical protein
VLIHGLCAERLYKRPCPKSDKVTIGAIEGDEGSPPSLGLFPDPVGDPVLDFLLVLLVPTGERLNSVLMLRL